MNLVGWFGEPSNHLIHCCPGWLDGITDATDMNWGKLQEMVRDTEAWHAAVHGVAKSQTWLGNWTIPVNLFYTNSAPGDWQMCKPEMNACFTPLNFWMSVQFSSVQSLSRVRLFATPWTAACQASLSITNSRSPPKPMSIESVMPSSHLILCCPLLLLPPIPISIRVFSNESTFRRRWPKYWSFSFSVIPSKEHPGLISLHSFKVWFSWTDPALPKMPLRHVIPC